MDSAARGVYGEAVEAVREAVKDHAQSPGPVEEQVDAVARALRSSLQSDPRGLLLLTASSTAGNFLYAHSVNVAILGLQILLGLDRAEPYLQAWGRSALLHDVLRLTDPDLAPEKGSPGEHLDRRLHPESAATLFEYARTLEARLPAELRDAEPHPLGSRRMSPPSPQDARAPLSLGAGLLALCETYENFTHPRAWRKAKLPHDVLVSLLKMHRRESDQRLLKAFGERLSLFPPGSYVKLSSGELGRVTAIHPDSPSRPFVDILVRANKTAQTPPSSVDLSREAHLHITGPIGEEDLPAKVPLLRLRVEALRWWMRE